MTTMDNKTDLVKILKGGNMIIIKTKYLLEECVRSGKPGSMMTAAMTAADEYDEDNEDDDDDNDDEDDNDG